MPLDIALLPAAMAGLAALALLWDLTFGGRVAAPRFLRPSARAPRAVAPAADPQALQRHLAEMAASVQRLREAGHAAAAERDAARAEAAALRLALSAARAELAQQAATSPGPPEPAGRFRAAKLAFARLYHPDRAGGSELDRLVRGQVFREFWTELERIEKS